MTSEAEGLTLLDRAAVWSIRPRSLAFRLAWGAVAYVLATGLRVALDPYLPAGFPFLTYFPAVALTAFVAGSAAGAAVAVLSLLTAWLLFIPPFGSFAVHADAALALLLYIVVISTEVGLVYLMRRAIRRAARAEARAQEVARQKTLMFAELQHRVSNNLAVVGSLLSLQRRKVADPVAIRALEVAAQRLAVVARLSRLLHDPEAQEIDFGAFLRAVVPDAVAASGAEGRVGVDVDADPVVVPADKAVPLGLIATELLSNAIEHGFPGDRRGRIRVSLASDGGEVARLSVRDDGAGLPPGFDLDATRSLGLAIARQFAEQMGGCLAIREEGGVVSILTFPMAPA